MRYLVNTPEVITSINRAEALGRGCTGVTTEWYGTRSTLSGHLCLLINDDKALVGSTMVEPEWPPVDP